MGSADSQMVPIFPYQFAEKKTTLQFAKKLSEDSTLFEIWGSSPSVEKRDYVCMHAEICRENVLPNKTFLISSLDDLPFGLYIQPILHYFPFLIPKYNLLE